MFLSLGILTSLLAGVSISVSTGRLYSRQNYTAPPTAKYEVKKSWLDTDWTYKVGENPWQQYPRPLLQRSEWKNLNGVWQYRNASAPEKDTPPVGVDLGQAVLVPFCLESALSGIKAEHATWSWYRTLFEVPSSWDEDNRVLLNFGAVDYEAKVYVNGQPVGEHTGGYWSFTLDITSALSTNGTNELIVFVFDPTDEFDDIQIPIGKQTVRPRHIWYTPCSGIWQTVWLESAPTDHIQELVVNADMFGEVTMTASNYGNASFPVEVTFYETDSTDVKFKTKGTANAPFKFRVPDIDMWSPSSPTLYNMTVKMGSDVVRSYTGFRTIEKGMVGKVARPLLNGEFIFQMGTLDQGYWPDGLYTPPSLEAMEFDLLKLKELGYNMLRKHIKVETALFYQLCDKHGLLVYQDMPSLRENVPDPQKPCQRKPVIDPSVTYDIFGKQLEIMIKQLRSYPCIVTWIIYNEGWGQQIEGYPEEGFTERIRELDPTRLINAASGWHDHGFSDIHDNHHYPDSQCGTPWYSIQSTKWDSEQGRIALQGEFGGIGLNVSEKNLWTEPNAVAKINETYELDLDQKTWNERATFLLAELKMQTENYDCSGAIWTQTTDVEGEVNGMLTYDRRVMRPYVDQWRKNLEAIYGVARLKGNRTIMMERDGLMDGL